MTAAADASVPGGDVLANSGLPPPERTARAWEICRKPRRPARLDANLLILGLAHAVRMGVATASRGVEPTGDALLAVRLFAALQIKLLRCDCHADRNSHLHLLMPHLPQIWQVTLRHRTASIWNALGHSQRVRARVPVGERKADFDG